MNLVLGWHDFFPIKHNGLLSEANYEKKSIEGCL